LILERQREEIDIAKQKGAFKGRKRTTTEEQRSGRLGPHCYDLRISQKEARPSTAARSRRSYVLDSTTHHPSLPRPPSFEFCSVDRRYYPFNTSIKVLLEFMLPQPDNRPPHFAEHRMVLGVTLAVFGYFVFPEVRHFILPRRELVSMPKITVNKDGHLCSAEYHVRLAGQIFDVFAEPKPLSVKHRSNLYFKPCVFRRGLSSSIQGTSSHSAEALMPIGSPEPQLEKTASIHALKGTMPPYASVYKPAKTFAIFAFLFGIRRS